jgi:hypothetical protein
VAGRTGLVGRHMVAFDLEGAVVQLLVVSANLYCLHTLYLH